MPLLDYNNFQAVWSEIGSGNCKSIFEQMLDAPVGSSRKDFIRLLEADTHFGKAAARFQRGRGMIGVPGGTNPSAGVRSTATRTPIGTAIGVNIIAVGFAKLTMEEGLRQTAEDWQRAEHEVNLMLLALIKTCRKLATKTDALRAKTFSRGNGQKKRTRIFAYSRQ